MAGSIVCLIFLGLSGMIDYRKKTIPLIIPMLFSAAGILCRMIFGDAEVANIAMGLIPGAVMLLLSFATGGAVGPGDGLVIASLGIFTGLWGCVLTVFFSFVFSGMAALVLLIVKKNNKYAMPFLPFLLAGYVVWLISEV